MNMAVAVIECGELHVVLWLHSDEDPPEAEWSEAMSKIRAGIPEAKSHDKIVSLALSDGGAPNSVQRKELFADVLSDQVRSCALTTALSNPLKRGIATALGWLNPKFRIFGPDQVGRALEYLDLLNYKDEVARGLLELQELMPPNQTMSLALSR